MGLEKNTTITEQDNAERSRQVLGNQTREELHKQHGQKLEAKRDISAQPENLSSSASAVKQPEKSARDKLDNRSTIEDIGCTEDKAAKTISVGEMDAGVKLDRNNVIDRQQGLSENKDKESGVVEETKKEDIVKESRESELWEKNRGICGEHFDKATSNVEKDQYGNDYKSFTQKEKEALSSKLKENINNIPKGERGDYRVPEPEKIKGVSRDNEGNIRIKEAWKDGTDGAKDGTRYMETVKAKDENGSPTYIDRIGSSNGNYFSPMKEDGTPYSLRERATGDYLPEKNIEDNDSYHKYKVKEDFTRENFEKAIDRTYVDPDIKQDKLDQIESYYSDALSSVKTDGHDGEAYKYNGNNIDGVKSGEIDNMFGTENNPDGGGRQYITPFSAKELEKMGMIEEVKKEAY